MPRITIYRRTSCSYCDAAKYLLEAKGVEPEEIDVTKNPELRADMEKRTGGSDTLPQIFIGERHIGGCDELIALDRKGELEVLLSGEAGSGAGP